MMAYGESTEANGRVLEMLHGECADRSHRHRHLTRVIRRALGPAEPLRAKNSFLKNKQLVLGGDSENSRTITTV